MKQVIEQVFSATPHGYLVLDPHFQIIDVNQMYLSMTGSERQDLIGVNLFDAFPDNPDDAKADGTNNLRRSLETVLATRQAHAMAVQKYDIPIRGDETGAFEERYWKPLNTPVEVDGEIVAIIHHVEDVTEQTINRRDQAIRLRLAASISDLAFWEYDPQTDIANVSRALAVMFGFGEIEGTMPAAPFFERIHLDDADVVRKKIAEALEKEDRTTYFIEHRIILPSGETRWVSSHGEVFRDHPNAAPRLVGVAVDITETKHREETLQNTLLERDRLLEQKEILLADVNHRIKNSLQLVSSILQLDARSADSEEVKRRLETAASRVQAVSSVHELIYTANQVSTVSFAGYLEDLVAFLTSSSIADNKKVTTECDSTEFVLSTDMAISIALLVNELVTNAIKHAFVGREKGTIRVTARLEDEELELSVTDDGIGKPKGVTEGLGSQIIASLVQQLEGTLEESSADPGLHVTIRAKIDR